MRNHVRVLLAASVASLGGPALAAELNTLRDLKVIPTEGGAQVVVSGTSAPTFTMFRLNDPDRLVVDLSSADASAIKGHQEGAGPIAGVVTSQFSDERASVGRVVVSLERATQYDVRADGNRVVISVDGERGTSHAEASPADMPTTKAEAATPSAAPARESSQVEQPAPIDPPSAAEAKASDVVDSQVDERPVKHPARHLTGLAFRRDTLTISTDGELPKYEIIQLQNPPRLAIDLYGLSSGTRAPKIKSDRVKDLRVGAHADKVRLVLDAKGDMPEFHAARTPKGVEIHFGALPDAPSNKTVVAAAPAEPAKMDLPKGLKDGEAEIDGQKISAEHAETAPLTAKAPGPQAAPKHASVEIKDIGFDEDPNGGRVNIKLSGETTWTVEHPDPRTAVLTLASARLPKKLERSFDTSALETPVKMVSAFAVPGTDDHVRVVVAASGAISDTVSKNGQGLTWRIEAKGVKTEQVAVNQKTAGFSAEAPTYAAEGSPRQRRHYVGKKVSFEFKDIDIHNLLRVIAEVSKKNIVVADDVKGTVTIRLRNVPWDEALELILRSKGLGKEELGNVIRVAPLKTLEDEAKSRAERIKAQQVAEPLIVQLVPVNYAPAADMASRVKDVLSERGNVTVDARTNTLIIRDVASNISKARSLITTLDLPTPQVLIESRIVEANVTYTKQIGVQWGGQGSLSPATGNPTGLAFPNTAVVTGGGGASPNIGTASTPNFAVNLPAAVGQGSGGALGFIFGSAGGAIGLNLRLSALENTGAVKTISAPKVTTLDNVTAKISQGVSIPFSQTSASGVNTTFIEARLSLEVTPHITQDGSVLMAINAQNNQPDPSNTGANGQPAIQRKEATTQVLVKDGDTTVIGGIYIRRGSTATQDVPFFAKIPILGFFFRTNTDTDSRQELLIFITPRIVNRRTLAQNL